MDLLISVLILAITNVIQNHYFRNESLNAKKRICLSVFISSVYYNVHTLLGTKMANSFIGYVIL